MTLELSNRAAPPSGEVIIRPEPSSWPALPGVRGARQPALPSADVFRKELALPVDRPLIMTGHQVEFWHPGVLAKYLAADAAAEAMDAHVAWLFVDQDPTHAVGLRYPAAADGRFVARSIEYTAAGAATALPQAKDVAAPFVHDGVRRIDEALQRHMDKPVLAQRIAAVLLELVGPLLAHRPHPGVVFATELSRTTLFGELVERMASRPERVCEAYNAAVSRHPSANVRPLLASEVQDQYELPLWHMSPNGVRRRVYAEMLDSVPREQLAPRALFMTGLLRLAGCDLFIHGTGGGGDEAHEGYDRITEDWLGRWLGIDAVDLAPAVVVSATRLLPLSSDPLPTAQETARALWLAHHARHDPGVLGDRAAADRKWQFVTRIGTSSDRNERGVLFEQMHALLTEYRRWHRDELAELTGAAETVRLRLQSLHVLLDRTWPFALYPAHVLEELRREIRACFGLEKR